MPSDNSTKMAEPFGDWKHSLLGRLPAELRVMVYEFATEAVFDAEKGKPKIKPHAYKPKPGYERDPTLRQLLAPMRVCKQMRSEMLPVFFHSRAVRLRQQRSEFDRHLPIAVPSEENVKVWSEAIEAIPTHLRSELMKFEYQYVWSPWSEYSSQTDGALQDVKEFKEGLQKLIHAAGQNELVVSINIVFRTLGATSSTECYYEPEAHNAGSHNLVCCKDDPMMVHECEALHVKIPTKDATCASKVVKYAFAQRRKRLEVHLNHRMCFIRPGVGKSLARLADAEKKLQEVMEHLPYSSGTTSV